MSGCRVHGLPHGPVVCDAGMLPVGIQTMLETILVDLTTLLLVGPHQLFEADGLLLKLLPFIVKVRPLSPSIVKVRVAGWWYLPHSLSLSPCLLLSLR